MKTHTLRFLTLLTTGCVGGILTLPNISAEQSQPFPTNWGEPPAIQTHDYVEWPGGYGHGSGTVAKWIAENLEKDKASLGSRNEVLYAADFSTVEVGKLPEDFLVLNGEFAVQADAGKKFIELPGTPIESFAVMFGPAEKENVSVSAKIRGTSRGRRYPAFALGINGLGGYRLNLIPAKRSLELFRGPEDGGEVVSSESFGWKSGSWTHFKLQVRKTGANEWRVEGKAWMEGGVEPDAWMVSALEQKEPLPGRAFVAGSPFSGTPIQFDGLVVSKTHD